MLTTMRFAHTQAESSKTQHSITGGCGATVCINAIDVAGLSEEMLREQISLIGQAESKLAALKSQALAEIACQHNTVTAERVVREELRSSKRAAYHDVKAAEQLATLQDTSQALVAGEIPQDHARLIARASSEGPINEQSLIKAAKEQGYDEFEKTLRRQQHDLSGDDGQAILERQKQKRTARMFKNRDTGMFILSGEYDPTTGEHIAAVVAAKERELWNQEDPKARRTPQQRMADALAELILESEKGKAKGIALVLVADYDATKRELVNARLADGNPLPMQELVHLALQADIFPAVFDAKTQNLWLGRSRRTATDAQRIALTIRDQGCIGCGAAPNRCFSHHVVFWKNGGPSDYPNLVLVCNDCHHNIHDQGWQTIKDTRTGKWTTQPPPGPFDEPFNLASNILESNVLKNSMLKESILEDSAAFSSSDSLGERTLDLVL
ncbi:MAG: DUF222 domain-containing protein [Acidimicrobiia bacterium]|nr:DUF222 domain-containing protein [Acidimicrobiia bacterium]